MKINSFWICVFNLQHNMYVKIMFNLINSTYKVNIHIDNLQHLLTAHKFMQDFTSYNKCVYGRLTTYISMDNFHHMVYSQHIVNHT